MATRIGVDVGGTFTDLLCYDDRTGKMEVAKVPTTPDSPELGVTNAVRDGLDENLTTSAAFFLHGTTVGLNALIERRGAVVGLLTTDGFRDSLEIRQGDKGNPWDLFWRQPEALVPRRRRLGVTERIKATGEIYTPLDLASVEAALEIFEKEGVSAIAVSFINSYANPEHEIAVEAHLRDLGFDGEISLSHRISGEFREYARTSTTTIDAFVRGRMAQYLSRLSESLDGLDFSGRKLVTRSGGGSMTFEEAEARPFETVNSGPVAGAEGAGQLARILGLDKVISADVGGTSFDTCLVRDGRPEVMYQGSIDGMPVQAQWVDVRSIGAGGGSVATIDVGGLMRVGPQSAGAVPGPACYGRGGELPTVTDAALVLGLLGKGELASGFALDQQLSHRAIATLTGPLGLEVEEVARGILRIAAANMADAIREITVEQGQDPREATLMLFGGAGPIFGTLLAEELEMATIVVPPYAGNFSAWGLLGSDLTETASRSRIMRLDAASVAQGSEVLGDLFGPLIERKGGMDTVESSAALDLRYMLQEYSLTIAVGWNGERIAEDHEAIRTRFDAKYERIYGHAMGDDVQIVSVRATARSPLPDRRPTRPGESNLTTTTAGGSVEGYSFASDRWTTFDLVDRDTIDEEGIEGPAILLEETTTTYLDEGFTAKRGAENALIISRKEG